MIPYIFPLLLSIFFSNPSPICSCAENGKITEEKYQSYDLILRGEIVKIQNGELDKALFIRIKTLYRGEHKIETIEIKTPSRPGFCGLNAGTGDEWLFFASSKNEKFSAHICTRSKNLNPDNHMYEFQKEEIQNDLIFLEAKLPLEE